MSLLIEAMERIVTFLESSHPIMVSIAQSLQPGLSEKEITSKLTDFPFLLPAELMELYQWRNGQADSCRYGLEPYYRLLSLEDALSEYRSQIELAMEFSEEDLPWQKLYDPCWLPIFEQDANHYVVSTLLEHQECSPILDKSEYDCVEDAWNSEIFPNLTSMMLAIGECWETGAYYIEKNIYGKDCLSIRFTKERKIKLKYQPKRKRAVELLLDGRKLDLSEEDLSRAYYDLVAINHPRAEEILKRDAQDSSVSSNFKYLFNELKKRQDL